MVITQKITSLAFEIHDGKANISVSLKVYVLPSCVFVCVFCIKRPVHKNKGRCRDVRKCIHALHTGERIGIQYKHVHSSTVNYWNKFMKQFLISHSVIYV